ncbi:MAG: LUD domain-containing protein [Candidatus Aminicenantales bacterium]
MLLRQKKKEVKKALRNRNLQSALDKASDQHFQKFQKTKEDIPWEALKEKARAIRQKCVRILPQLIEQFREEAVQTGARVYSAANPEEACAAVEQILQSRKARLIVKSKSMVSEEIGLNEFLEKRGYRVVETDLGEWIIQLAKERPSHLTAPALHKTKEEVAEILSRHLGRPVPPDIEKMVKIAREELRKYFIEADAGISGANLAIAESGTLVIVSNEGNARLATGLPPVHIALLTAEKFVQTMEEATTLIKALTTASSGLKLTSYVSFITGPSKTTDIEKDLVVGVHGPQEVHIIILDNGRLPIARDETLEEILYCLKCGGCMLLCPVFQAVGGHVFGGPVYPGGIGILLTAVTRSAKETDALLELCANCKKCEEFCPVGIPTSEILVRLKNWKSSSIGEKSLSFIFRNKRLAEFGAGILSFLQKFWEKNGYFKRLPFSWAKDKSFPILRLKKHVSSPRPKGPKAYLFQGCLVKFFFPEIRESVLKVLSHFGYKTVCPPDQVCCGAPSLHLGRIKDVQRLAHANLRSFARENPDILLTVCPTGNTLLKKFYPRLDRRALAWKDKIFDFTEFLVQKNFFPETKPLPEKETIFYHHSCHYVNALKLKEAPKTLLQKMGYDPKTEKEPFACCGFCGVFHLRNPEISAHLWKKKRGIILEQNISLIATDCPGCVFQLRANLKKDNTPHQIFHTAELCAKALNPSKT